MRMGMSFQKCYHYSDHVNSHFHTIPILSNISTVIPMGIPCDSSDPIGSNPNAHV